MWNQEVIIKAWNYAAGVHKDQKTPGMGYPYLNHLGLVAMEVMSAVSSDQTLNSELAIQCAILHDTIEDTDAEYADILSEFGCDVADGVMALTKDSSLGTKAEMMTDSLNRIKGQPKEVWMVKMADRITNLQPPPHYWTNEKITAYRDEAIMIYDALRSANTILAERLKAKIDNYLEYL